MILVQSIHQVNIHFIQFYRNYSFETYSFWNMHGFGVFLFSYRIHFAYAFFSKNKYFSGLTNHKQTYGTRFRNRRLMMIENPYDSIITAIIKTKILIYDFLLIMVLILQPLVYKRWIFASIFRNHLLTSSLEYCVFTA